MGALLHIGQVPARCLSEMGARNAAGSVQALRCQATGVEKLDPHDARRVVEAT